MADVKKTRKLVLIIIIVIVVIAVGTNLVRVYIVKTAMEQGKNAYDQAYDDLAITNYNRAIKFCLWDKEKKADSYLWRGRSYYEKEEYDQALADFTKAIELKRDYYPYYTWRGRAYHQIKNYDLAIVDFTEAIKIDSDITYGGHEKFVERGDVYFDKGDYALAINDYEQAIVEIDSTIEIRTQLDWDNSELYKWRNDIINKKEHVEWKKKNPEAGIMEELLYLLENWSDN